MSQGGILVLYGEINNGSCPCEVDHFDIEMLQIKDK